MGKIVSEYELKKEQKRKSESLLLFCESFRFGCCLRRLEHMRTFTKSEQKAELPISQEPTDEGLASPTFSSCSDLSIVYRGLASPTLSSCSGLSTVYQGLASPTLSSCSDLSIVYQGLASPTSPTASSCSDFEKLLKLWKSREGT